MKICIFLSALLILAASSFAVSDDRGVKVVENSRDNRKRVALVIGNSKYHSSPLKNPVNDAHVMATSLRRLGFEVQEQTNLSYIEMNKSVESFGRKLKTGGVGLFFYAGHGMQVNGANYLIPVDAQIEDENEVRFKAVDAGLVLAKMEQAKSDVNIVILDACRDNPFTRSFRSASKGLASIDAPSGTFIAYATAPGKTAADGSGKNGLYTEELSKVLESPGIPLEQVFKRALKSVREKSGNKQIPWVASNLEGEFYFTSPPQMTDLHPSSVQPQTVNSQNKRGSKEISSDGIIDDLQWALNGNLAKKEMNWHSAKKWVKKLSYNNHNDWRLPKCDELKGLAAIGGAVNSANYLNSNGFKNVQAGWYWSSTDEGSNGNSICIVHMGTGQEEFSFIDGIDLFVWPVRSAYD